MIIHGDSLNELKDIDSDSIDAIITDPPYGYSFMGKDWDKAVPSVEIWKECLRVLKPGAFCMVMSAPRSDVQNAMISRLIEAGFRLDFTPIYWTYASGFPKAGNIGKLVDKRLGVEREVIGVGNVTGARKAKTLSDDKRKSESTFTNTEAYTSYITAPASDKAKELDGSYAGFQPKPAVEVIIVAMKPLSEKTYVDQALHNGKGVTWLDDARIPTEPNSDLDRKSRANKKAYNNSSYHIMPTEDMIGKNKGRFPANLLVSDDILNDGITRKSGSIKPYMNKHDHDAAGWKGIPKFRDVNFKGDSGSYSRFFDLDAWASTLPFLILPKASKSEKNTGILEAEGNRHPTVKPLKLMSYLITLTSRPGDKILDPFVGSGTTAVAAVNLQRVAIGIDRDEEYVKIARARVEHAKSVIRAGSNTV